MSFLSCYRHWALAIFAAVLLVVSVPYVRFLSEFLRAQGVLQLTLNLFVGFMVVVFFWCWIKTYKNFSWPRAALLAAILSTYGWAWKCWIVTPEERVHFVSPALLAYLFYRALRYDNRSLNVRTLGAGLLAALVGVAEEGIQLWVPGRGFEWSDLGKCVFSATLAVMILRFVLDSEQRC